MRADLMGQLADLLEEDAANEKGGEFNISLWGATPDRYTEPTLSCGTHMCGLGLAAISGKFPGLTWKRDPHIETGIIVVFTDATKWEWRGYSAAAELFQIERFEAEYLFAPVWYPVHLSRGAKGERYMAARIRRFIENREDRDYNIINQEPHDADVAF